MNQQTPSADTRSIDGQRTHVLDGRGNLWTKSYWKWGLSGLVGFLVGLFVGYSVDEVPLAKQPVLPSMSQCVTDTLGLLGPNVPQTAEMLQDARGHCYSLIQAEGVFNDFSVRKLNFYQQYRANGVLMWMVVAVTFSGVLLAGLQLSASYHLAVANRTPLDGHDGEFIWQRDRLALKSSITGLFILLISFCFFLVFVFYVYRFERLEDNVNPARPAAVTGPMDGLGPPSQTKDKP